MKSLEVWRKGYKAEFSPGLGRSKCKVSPLPCLPWDSVGGVGQGRFRILHKSGIASPVLWCSPGLSSGLVCWDCWQYGRIAWALALSGVQAGRRSFTVIFWPFLFPFLSPVSLSSPFHLLGGAGSAVWLAGGLHQLGASGCPLPSCWPWVLCWLPWVQVLAAVLSLPCVLSLSWVLALGGAGAAVSLSLSPGCWRSSAVLWCWPAMRWGWVLALGGVGAGLSRPWRWWLAGAGGW